MREMINKSCRCLALCYFLIWPSLGQETATSASAGEMVTVERVVDRAPKGTKWVKAQKGDPVPVSYTHLTLPTILLV